MMFLLWQFAYYDVSLTTTMTTLLLTYPSLTKPNQPPNLTLRGYLNGRRHCRRQNDSSQNGSRQNNVFPLSIYIKWANRCLSVGMWRANGNPNHCMDLDKILHPHCPREVLVQFWPRLPSPMGWGCWPETLKAEGHIFENRLQNKRCSAGCKLTQTVPVTSAC